MCVCLYIQRETHIFFISLFLKKVLMHTFLTVFREKLVKANKEAKHQMSYSGRVKTLCLQKNTALWIGTGGGHILLLDLSARRIICIIHSFCDSVRAMMTAQLGKFLSFRSFFSYSLRL